MCLVMIHVIDVGGNIGAFQRLVGAIDFDLDMVPMLLFLCILSPK